MPTIVSSSDVETRAYHYDNEDGTHGTTYMTRFIGDPDDDQIPGPQAVLVKVMPAYVIPPHFHGVDQFQVIIEGDGQVGKHAVKRGSVHYSDAFTPYGPIVAGVEGVAYYVLRARPELGAKWMPASRSEMPRRARRALYVDAEEHGRERPPVPVVKQPLPPTQDGLLAHSYWLPPDAEQPGPSPASGGGQYYIVLNGTWQSDGQPLPPGSLVFVAPDEEAPVIRAGTEGVEVVVVQLPRDTTL